MKRHEIRALHARITGELLNDGSQSNREIARKIGCSHSTVSKVRKMMRGEHGPFTGEEAKKSLDFLADEGRKRPSMLETMKRANERLSEIGAAFGEHMPTDEDVLMELRHFQGRDTYTVIEWRDFVVSVGGNSGISVRKLVEAGLYTRFSTAREALARLGMSGRSVRCDQREDILLSLKDAQLFCVRTRNAAGEMIAELIISHHNEFQRLLDGDAQVAARVAHHITQQPSMLDLFESSVAALRQIEQRQVETSKRFKEIEEQVVTLSGDRFRREGEVSAKSLAARTRCYSVGGHPHNRAVIALAMSWDFDRLGLMRQIHVEAFAGQDRPTNPMWVFSIDGVVEFERRLAEAYGDEDFCAQSGSVNYNVKRMK